MNRFYSKQIFRIVFLGLILVIASGLLAADWNKRKVRSIEKNFPVDYATFRAEQPDQVKLEIYYQIFNFFLEFDSSDISYLARYEFDVKIYDNDDSLIVSDSVIKDIRVNSKSRTNSRTDYRTNQFNFVLEPGKYEVKTTLRDINTRRIFHKDFKVKLRAFDKKPIQLSDIEFVQLAGELKPGAEVFAKSELMVIPSINRMFGGQGENNKLLFYIEVYSNDRAPDDLFMVTVLRNKRKSKMAYRDSLTLQLDEPIKKQLREIDLDKLAPGDYELEIYLQNHKKKKYVKRISDFTILMTPESMLRHDYDNLVRQISYIAESGEVKKLKAAKSIDERMAAYKEYWKSRDPSPGTVENEVKQEFYRRVAFVNSTYSYLRKDGWRTDRGRIYIVFGPPDQINDYPYSTDLPPYVEWHYFSSSRYRKFVFVDYNDDGEYRLNYPYDGLNQRPDF